MDTIPQDVRDLVRADFEAQNQYPPRCHGWIDGHPCIVVAHNPVLAPRDAFSMVLAALVPYVDYVSCAVESWWNISDNVDKTKPLKGQPGTTEVMLYVAADLDGAAMDIDPFAIIDDKVVWGDKPWGDEKPQSLEGAMHDELERGLAAARLFAEAAQSIEATDEERVMLRAEGAKDAVEALTAVGFTCAVVADLDSPLYAAMVADPDVHMDPDDPIAKRITSGLPEGSFAGVHVKVVEPAESLLNQMAVEELLEGIKPIVIARVEPRRGEGVNGDMAVWDKINGAVYGDEPTTVEVSTYTGGPGMIMLSVEHYDGQRSLLLDHDAAMALVNVLISAVYDVPPVVES